jgi:hypothetical protein
MEIAHSKQPLYLRETTKNYLVNINSRLLEYARQSVIGNRDTDIPHEKERTKASEDYQRK